MKVHRSHLSAAIVAGLVLAGCAGSAAGSDPGTANTDSSGTIADTGDTTDTAASADVDSSDDAGGSTRGTETAEDTTTVDDSAAGGSSTAVAGATGGDYLGDYELTDADFGTQVNVTVADGVRTIDTNAIPNHETGEFPNAGNPNTISPQDITWTFAANANWTGAATPARISGVALNGVKFEPGTAERVDCASGESYRVEAIEDTFDLGLDFNNAHVQPTGEYHYHGVSQLLVDAYATDSDLVLVGFAPDGYLIYYSKSDAYTSGYSLSSEPRAGTDCTYTIQNQSVDDLEGTIPDGTYNTDWVWDAATGDLDECNGIEIDGQYAYIITDTYPFIGRCLNGEFDASAVGEGGGAPPPGGAPGQPPPPGQGPPPGGGPPPGQGPPPGDD